MDPTPPQTSREEDWTEMQKLLASDGAAEDYFGCLFLLMVTPLSSEHIYDDNAERESGSAYVFTRTGTTWTQQAKLLASDGAAGDYFGYSVSLDGDTALIGADWMMTTESILVLRMCSPAPAPPGHNKQSSSPQMVQQRIILAVLFLLMVTPPSSEHVMMMTRIDSGSAYVFTRTGTTWTQQAKAPRLRRRSRRLVWLFCFS